MTPFQQKDGRWSSEIYSSINDKSQTIGQSGCGLLALTNAVYAITNGQKFLNPVALDKLSVKNGFRTPNNGTSWGFVDWYVKNELSNEFSITHTSDINRAISMLNSGNCAVYTACHGNAEKIFTSSGHYVSIDKYTQDGFFSVLDSDFYRGKYDVGNRVTAIKNGKLKVNAATLEIWCKSDLFKQEMNAIGYVAITCKNCYAKNETRENNMPSTIHWFSKVSELPDWARPAIKADVRQGIIMLQSDNDSFSAPKSDIEIQGRVEAYRHFKKLGLIADDLVTKL